MRAFVLSGGGNYGALQAGALQALVQNGLLPDLVIGASAGAVNASWFAAHPTVSGVRDVCGIWIDQAPQTFPPLASVQSVVRLARGKDGQAEGDESPRGIADSRLIPRPPAFGALGRAVRRRAIPPHNLVVTLKKERAGF